MQCWVFCFVFGGMLKPRLQSILLWLFWRWGLMNYFPRLASNEPQSSRSQPSQMLRITGVSPQHCNAGWRRTGSGLGIQVHDVKLNWNPGTVGSSSACWSVMQAVNVLMTGWWVLLCPGVRHPSFCMILLYNSLVWRVRWAQGPGISNVFDPPMSPRAPDFTLWVPGANSFIKCASWFVLDICWLLACPSKMQSFCLSICTQNGAHCCFIKWSLSEQGTAWKLLFYSIWSNCRVEFSPIATICKDSFSK
jgi:hypothetical protein